VCSPQSDGSLFQFVPPFRRKRSIFAPVIILRRRGFTCTGSVFLIARCPLVGLKRLYFRNFCTGGPGIFVCSDFATVAFGSSDFRFCLICLKCERWRRIRLFLFDAVYSFVTQQKVFSTITYGELRRAQHATFEGFNAQNRKLKSEKPKKFRCLRLASHIGPSDGLSQTTDHGEKEQRRLINTELVH